jgi:hypothetical protein
VNYNPYVIDLEAVIRAWSLDPKDIELSTNPEYVEQMAIDFLKLCAKSAKKMIELNDLHTAKLAFADAIWFMNEFERRLDGRLVTKEGIPPAPPSRGFRGGVS